MLQLPMQCVYRRVSLVTQKLGAVLALVMQFSKMGNNSWQSCEKIKYVFS